MWDWFTYFIFVFTLLISFPFLWVFDRKKKFNGALLLVGLLPSFLLLALRGRTVGVDLDAYEIHIQLAKDFQLSNLVLFFGEPIAEIIYRVSFLLGGLRAFIIITAILEYIFIYIAFKKLHKCRIDISIIFIFFYGVVVLRSFNIVLNCLAITCSLCAYVNLLCTDKRSKYMYWFYTIIAIGLHNTAVINIPIYFLCAPIKAFKTLKDITFIKNSYKIKIFKNRVSYQRYLSRDLVKRTLLMVISVFVVYVLLLQFIDLIKNFNNGQYSQYESSDSGIRLGIILSKIPFLLFVWLFRKSLNKQFSIKYIPFLLLLFFDLIFAQTRYIFNSFQRFSMYTDLGRIFLIGFICMALYNKYKHDKEIVIFIAVIYGIFISFSYWLYTYEILGGDGNGIGLMPYSIW